MKSMEERRWEGRIQVMLEAVEELWSKWGDRYPDRWLKLIAGLGVNINQNNLITENLEQISLKYQPLAQLAWLDKYQEQVKETTKLDDYLTNLPWVGALTNMMQADPVPMIIGQKAVKGQGKPTPAIFPWDGTELHQATVEKAWKRKEVQTRLVKHFAKVTERAIENSLERNLPLAVKQETLSRL